MNLIKEPKFDIRLMPEADEFLQSLEEEERNHIYLKLSLAQYGSDPRKFVKVRGDIWEFRFSFKKNAYRIYAFWCEKERKLVVATHGVMKKTQKALNKEIKKAEKLREIYYQ